MWERKLRILGGWLANFVLRRDVVAIAATKTPRLAFETFASRPSAAPAAKPSAKKIAAKPAAKKAAVAKAPAKKAAPKKK
jgi:NADH dehydrogenase